MPLQKFPRVIPRDKIALIKEDSLYEEFPGVLRDALNAGADVSIKTSLDAEVLGIEVL